MSDSLHPELRGWIERESTRILSLVQDLSDLARQRTTSSMHPDTHVQANVMPEDIIGEVVLSFSDVTGKKVAHFYPHGDAILGLANENLRQAQEIAERIWSRREVRDHLSADTVEELLLEWVGAAARGQPTQALAQRIDEVLLKRVRVVSVWVPIEATLIEGDLQFADSMLMMLSRVDLDRAFDSAFSTRPSDHVGRVLEEIASRLGREGSYALLDLWRTKASPRASLGKG